MSDYSEMNSLRVRPGEGFTPGSYDAKSLKAMEESGKLTGLGSVEIKDLGKLTLRGRSVANHLKDCERIGRVIEMNVFLVQE